MSEISLAIGDGARRMTYAELAQARGISLAAARRLTLRHRWHKQLGNDGLVVVSVPLSALKKPRKPVLSDDTTSRHSVIPDGPVSDPVRDAGSDGTRPEHMLQAIRETVEALMTPVREQLDHERARADQAEEKAAALRAELVDLRIAEQAAANLAEYGTAQAVDLRKRLEAAEQRASDERNRADRAEQRVGEERERANRAEKRADDEQGRADRERQRADQAEARVDDERARADRERDRADKTEQQLTAVEVDLVMARAEAAGLRCQLEQARPKPPRTRWGRLLRALGHTR